MGEPGLFVGSSMWLPTFLSSQGCGDELVRERPPLRLSSAGSLLGKGSCTENRSEAAGRSTHRMTARGREGCPQAPRGQEAFPAQQRPPVKVTGQTCRVPPASIAGLAIPRVLPAPRRTQDQPKESDSSDNGHSCHPQKPSRNNGTSLPQPRHHG